MAGQVNGPMGDGNQLKDIAFPILDDEMSQQIRAMITGEQTQVAMNGVSIKNGLNNNQVCAVYNEQRNLLNICPLDFFIIIIIINITVDIHKEMYILGQRPVTESLHKQYILTI